MRSRSVALAQCKIICLYCIYIYLFITVDHHDMERDFTMTGLSFPLELLDRMRGTVSVIGSMNVDYTITTEHLPKPGETVTGGALTLLPGGKSGNQAVAAALLGADVRMFGAVGTDANAVFLLDHLDNAGVDISHIQRVDGPSGLTVITVDNEAENTIVYSAGSNAHVDVDYAKSVQEPLTSASVLGLCLESPLDTVTQAAKMAHEAGMTVLLNNSPFMADLPEELIKYSDILLLNEVELLQLLKIDTPEGDDWTTTFDWEGALDKLKALGFTQAVVTLGSKGSVVLDDKADERVARIEPVRVEAVDTTGCGDSFMGTVLAALSSGWTLTSAARAASYVSAYAATGRGAQASYGTPSQIREYFAPQGSAE